MNRIDSDYLPYIDPWDFCQPDMEASNPNNPSVAENSIRFDVERQWARFNAGVIDDIEVAEIDAKYRSCQVKGHPGLYHRHPNRHHNRQMGHDDIIYLALWCEISGERFIAQDILHYGRKWTPIPYHFNNRNPSRLSFHGPAFLGRHWQDFVAVKAAAREKLNWFDRKFFCYVVDRTTREAKPLSDQDSWCLTAALVRMTRYVSDLKVQQSRKNFLARFKEVYPEGYGEVLSRKHLYHGRMSSYFSEYHPTCKWLRGVWGR